MRSTRCADREIGCSILDQGTEFAWRSVAERLVRMDGVVVLEPRFELLHHRCRIGPWANLRIVALEGLHERLCHAVGLRALGLRAASVARPDEFGPGTAATIPKTPV